jgi:hypothetical protein
MVIESEISMTQLYKNNVLTLGMLSIWVKRYQEGGLQALENKRKPAIALSKYQSRKSLTPMEQHFISLIQLGFSFMSCNIYHNKHVF